MLIGMGSSKKMPAAEKNDHVFSVTSADFEKKILEESQKRPVLIDFWAPWCGPCKQLMPVLEKVVAAQNGRIALAKVNIDENPDLAQAFRVQSVPMVVAFYKGQPVTGFAGARPQSDIEKLVKQLIDMGGQTEDLPDIDMLLTEAAGFLAEKEYGNAGAIYAEILDHDGNQTQALAGMMRTAILQGELVEARQLFDSIPEKLRNDRDIVSAATMLELAEAVSSSPLAETEARLRADPANPEFLFDHAEACFAAGEKDLAVDSLIDSIRADRQWENEKARKQLLKYLEAWGFMDPASVVARRKLSSLLFS